MDSVQETVLISFENIVALREQDSQDVTETQKVEEGWGVVVLRPWRRVGC
jgi:hypothetical protein